MHFVLRQNLLCKMQGEAQEEVNLKMAVLFQGVENLDSISLGGSKKKLQTGRFYTGKDCEWIDLNKVKS